MSTFFSLSLLSLLIIVAISLVIVAMLFLIIVIVLLLSLAVIVIVYVFYGYGVTCVPDLSCRGMSTMRFLCISPFRILSLLVFFFLIRLFIGYFIAK